MATVDVPKSIVFRGGDFFTDPLPEAECWCSATCCTTGASRTASACYAMPTPQCIQPTVQGDPVVAGARPQDRLRQYAIAEHTRSKLRLSCSRSGQPAGDRSTPSIYAPDPGPEACPGRRSATCSAAQEGDRALVERRTWHDGQSPGVLIVGVNLVLNPLDQVGRFPAATMSTTNVRRRSPQPTVAL